MEAGFGTGAGAAEATVVTGGLVAGVGVDGACCAWRGLTRVEIAAETCDDGAGDAVTTGNCSTVARGGRSGGRGSGGATFSFGSAAAVCGATSFDFSPRHQKRSTVDRNVAAEAATIQYARCRVLREATVNVAPSGGSGVDSSRVSVR